MKTILKNVLLITVLLLFTLVSCTSDATLDSTNEQILSKKASFSEGSKGIIEEIILNKKGRSLLENNNTFDIERAVIPSEDCDTNRPFDLVMLEEFSKIDTRGEFRSFLLFNVLNQVSVFDGIFNDYAAEQYFGIDAEYTNYIQNRQRNLEKFWSMEDTGISVRGQHNKTLEDAEHLIYLLINYFVILNPDDPFGPPIPYTEEMAAIRVNELMQVAEESDFVTESPVLSMAGFTTIIPTPDGNLHKPIVIGDGLIELISRIGLDPKVVWSNILAHEWAHQIQFENNWVTQGIPTPEDTRRQELEADFFASYYLTHKRGATYNWKRVEDVMEAFYSGGDCSFESPGHHGTPAERKEASWQGYLLAHNASPKSHILSTSELHEIFLDLLDDIVAIDN